MGHSPTEFWSSFDSSAGWGLLVCVMIKGEASYRKLGV